jgi:mono/diheme cytochrome c family protein
MPCSRELPPMKVFRCLFTVVALVASLRAADEPVPHPLVWDAMEKTSEPKPGDGAAPFEFTVTNRSKAPVTILQIRPSCGCTVVESPPFPWKLAPAEKGTVSAIVDFHGKDGDVAKALFVGTSAGPQTLLMHVKIPMLDEATRKQNQSMATADRQAVFRGECASCHAKPAENKYGEELFHAACAVCHISSHRASMVPDLFVARDKRDAGWWTKWITEGREGSLMPAFAAKHGGPLNDAQVDSLVEFVLANLPTAPRTN